MTEISNTMFISFFLKQNCIDIYLFGQNLKPPMFYSFYLSLTVISIQSIIVSINKTFGEQKQCMTLRTNIGSYI